MREFMSTSGRHGLAKVPTLQFFDLQVGWKNEVADAVSKITRAKKKRYIVRSAHSAEKVFPPYPVLASSRTIICVGSSPGCCETVVSGRSVNR